MIDVHFNVRCIKLSSGLFVNSEKFSQVGHIAFSCNSSATIKKEEAYWSLLPLHFNFFRIRCSLQNVDWFSNLYVNMYCNIAQSLSHHQVVEIFVWPRDLHYPPFHCSHSLVSLHFERSNMAEFFPFFNPSRSSFNMLPVVSFMSTVRN